MIYFDNSSTTELYPEVIEVMTDVLKKHYGNPSSLHALGVSSEKLLRKSREVIADTLSVLPEEIIFTSCGTEGDNLALKGIALEYQNRGKHIITSVIEHPAILKTCEQLEKMGFEVSYLKVDKEGLVDPLELERNIREDTILVSIMHVNNEVGSVQKIQEIGEILKKHRTIFFHVDGVQGFGKVALDLKGWGVDLYTLSSHKIHGPKGMGALYVRKGISLSPLLAGGGQESGVRSGTENLPSIVGFAKACQITCADFEKKYENILEIKKYLVEKLSQEIKGIVFNGPLETNHSPYILNLSIKGVKGEVLLHALENRGIYVSTGSACSSKKDIFSPVLSAMKVLDEIKLGAIRLSFSDSLTKEEADFFIKSLKDILIDLGR